MRNIDQCLIRFLNKDATWSIIKEIVINDAIIRLLDSLLNHVVIPDTNKHIFWIVRVAVRQVPNAQVSDQPWCV